MFFPGFLGPFLAILLTVIFVLYGIYILYFVAVNVSYDASFLYIADRKTEKIIPFEKVTSIKRASSPLSLRIRWRIAYIDMTSVEDELYFYPEANGAITDFAKAVRRQNPAVEY
jgi:hypothetical protein